MANKEFEFEVLYYSDCNNHDIAVIINFDHYEDQNDIVSVTLMEDDSPVDYEESAVQREIDAFLDQQYEQGAEISLESRVELARMV